MRSVAETDAVVMWEWLVRYQRATLQVMDTSLRAAFGHSLDDYDVLHQVALGDEPMRMGRLAESLLVANSSCTRIVGRLVESGHLDRRRGLADRREVLVGITAEGRRLHRRMAAHHTRDIRRLFGARLSTGAQSGLERALTELLAPQPLPE